MAYFSKESRVKICEGGLWVDSDDFVVIPVRHQPVFYLHQTCFIIEIFFYCGLKLAFFLKTKQKPDCANKPICVAFYF